MSELAKATTQYGDLYGTISIDGFDGISIYDLLDEREIPKGYYPIGIKLAGFSRIEGNVPKLDAKVLCVDSEHVAMNDLHNYCSKGKEVHTFQCEATVDLERVVRHFKNLSIVLLSKSTRNGVVKIQPIDD